MNKIVCCNCNRRFHVNFLSMEEATCPFCGFQTIFYDNKYIRILCILFIIIEALLTSCLISYFDAVIKMNYFVSRGITLLYIILSIVVIYRPCLCFVYNRTAKFL